MFKLDLPKRTSIEKLKLHLTKTITSRVSKSLLSPNPFKCTLMFRNIAQRIETCRNILLRCFDSMYLEYFSQRRCLLQRPSFHVYSTVHRKPTVGRHRRAKSSFSPSLLLYFLLFPFFFLCLPSFLLEYSCHNKYSIFLFEKRE